MSCRNMKIHVIMYTFQRDAKHNSVQESMTKRILHIEHTVAASNTRVRRLCKLSFTATIFLRSIFSSSWSETIVTLAARSLVDLKKFLTNNIGGIRRWLRWAQCQKRSTAKLSALAFVAWLRSYFQSAAADDLEERERGGGEYTEMREIGW